MVNVTTRISLVEVSQLSFPTSRNLVTIETTITFTDGYPAMPPSEGNLALFEHLSAVSVDLGEGPLSQVDPGRRGAADISFVGRLAPSLAGLGPVRQQSAC